MSELQDNLTEILRQKNTYLLPTNIRSGVTILGVTGTLEDADTLTNTVTNLENQVVELTEALENKTAGSIPNIFVQSTEPTSKDGIWLQTNDYTMSGVIAYQNTIPNETWNTTKMAQVTDIPYRFTYSSGTSIGTDIYLFGSTFSSDYRKAYKYNTLTDTYTQLTNIPYDFYGGVAVSINSIEEIYLLGSSLNVNKIGIFELKSIEYEDNQIVITQGTPTYLTKILPNNSNLTYYFNDAWIYTDQDGLIQNIPTYYGDGTSWIKFKN